MDITEINSRGKWGELLGRIDRQNSRFRTAKTTIIKFGLHASFVESESAKNAVNEFWAKVKPKQSSPTVPKIGGEVSLRETSTPTTFPRIYFKVTTIVVKIYRFWNSGAGGARRLRRMQTKEGGSPPGSEPGRWFVIDKGFGDLY
ncbi:hypothetical protein TNCV_1522081 [Trichonephila clavipes]|nr:hypothetical protein TNCV_1522081 [Trichonephila clavipes]